VVFTPVKSASLLWALGSAHTRQAVEDAHHDAVTDTLAWLERETAFARIGDRGEAQVDTRGLIAAGFDHRDSRAGDPDLHTHLAISNKVRARADHPTGNPGGCPWTPGSCTPRPSPPPSGTTPVSRTP